MNDNLNNNVTPNNFPANSNVSNKHADLSNQFNKQAPAAPQKAPQQKQEYINPNNFQKVLGAQAQPVTQNSIPQNPSQANPNSPVPPVSAQDLRGAVPQMPVDQFYNNRPQPQAAQLQPGVASQKNSSDTTKLIIYAVPLVALFVHLLKSIDDEDTLWHSRQSLVGQGMWFAILVILRLIDAPILSDYGPMLVNIACYGLLLFAGVKAYDHQRYNIPVVYDIGRNFIDNKK